MEVLQAELKWYQRQIWSYRKEWREKCALNMWAYKIPYVYMVLIFLKDNWSLMQKIIATLSILMQRRVGLHCCQFSSVQLLSHVRLFATPWTVAPQASLSIINSRSLLKLKSIELVMPSNHLILCHPLLLLPSVLCSIRVISSELVLHIRWPKYWSFSFSFSPSNQYSGLIFFRIDWCDLLAVQGTLKSLLEHHSSKA